MRGEGAGKGDQIRHGVNWKKFGEGYDAIFRKKRRKKEHPGTKAMRELHESGRMPSVMEIMALETKYGPNIPWPEGMGNVRKV